MKKIIIPTITQQGFIEKVTISSNFIVGTTVGLTKATNEDRVGCVLNDDTLKICITDGHWGEKAAEIISEHWTTNGLLFPASKEAAVLEVKKIEERLFKIFGGKNMNPTSDFTPEASFISVKIEKNLLKAISYGDCRLLVGTEGKVKMQLPTKETWLGAFSRLGLRNRISVSQGLVFEEVLLQKNDVLLIFTDGIDQCVYEKDTLSSQFLANQTKTGTVKNIFNTILDAVLSAGAEDNASLVVLRI